MGVDIQHYAGEVFHLESDGMNFTATAATAGYATKLTKTSDFLLTVSDYIAGQVVNSTTYYFYLGANGSASNYVDITNNEGVKTRCQYWRGKLTSSYEVAGSDVSFVSDKFTGCVQIQKTMESPYNSGAMGAQYRNDGIPMTFFGIMPTFNSSGTMTAIANNGDALLATTTDEMRGEKARFTYDYCSRMLTKKEVTSSTNFATKVSKETFAYDDAKRMTQDVCIYDQPNAKQVTSTISYVKAATDPLADERVGTYTYAVKNSATAITQNTFDDLKRVKTKAHTIGGMQFKKTMSFDRTRVSRVRDTIVSTTKTDHYYDECNRIQKIDANGVISTYHYDQYGQLVREDNQGLDMTMVYEYNNIGNLISAKKYSYTASTSSPSGTPVTTSFGYTDDKLTSFGGATIAYNSMGCPTTYEGKNLTWSNGKLSRMSSGTLATGTDTYAFVYNAYGQRVSKTYSYLAGTNTAVQIGQLTASNKTYYYDHAGRLISETVSKTYNSAASSSESIVFLYDESSVIGMVHTVGSTANTYYFQRNLLGDVVAIYDTSGNMVAKYLYDAWGNCTISSETTNTIVANANPIRYRGYYYDDETGVYYLQSRYYNPEVGRFLNADALISTGQGVLGNNMFAYCGNNPVSRADASGHAFVQLAYSYDGVTNDLFPELGGGGGCGISYSALGYIAVDAIIHDPDVQEIVQVAEDIAAIEDVDDAREIVHDIMKNELVQDATAGVKIRNGYRNIKKGFTYIIFPAPSSLDEIAGGVLIAAGFGSLVMGIGEWFEWLEEDV